MKKENIRSKYVKDSLDEFNNISEILKENTTSAVKDLLNEAVRETYAKLLNESDDEDETDDDAYDVEEVEDTETDAIDNDDNAEDEVDVEETEESDTDSENDSDDAEEWSDFEKYKVSDDEYDFSNAEDDEVVKVYKLLNNDDQVVVKKTDDKVTVKDNETGAEYIIVLDDENPVEDDMLLDSDDDDNGVAETEIEVSYDTDNDIEDEIDDDVEDNVLEDDFEEDESDDDEVNENKRMKESMIFEIALNEYDSNVGYTDNYQKNDVMSNPGMSEPGKNVRDWDKGVPKGDAKPWSGYPRKAADKPFTAGKGKTVEEEDELEEGTNVGGFVQQNSTSKSHVPNSNGRSARSASKGGRRIKGTVTPRYSSEGENDVTTESIVRRANKIFTENRELKRALDQFKGVLKEAAVTNVNLGQIIKLLSENATSTDEKKEIIARFGKEAKTVKESRNLYESISRELKQKNKINISAPEVITEEKKVNETRIYKSDDLLSSLDLMHRLCK